MVDPQMVNNDAAQLEMAQIQQQLRMERAKLADAIGSRFDALTAATASTSKNKLTSKKETSSHNGNMQFTHRPVNLGLGAEKEAYNKNGTQDPTLRDDKRLRGVLMGKRKFDSDRSQNGGDKGDDEDENDSKASMLGTSTGKNGVNSDSQAKNNKKRKADPFAVPIKAKSKAKEEQTNGNVIDHSPSIDNSKQGSVDIPTNLSKKARKKLRKQQEQQIQTLSKPVEQQTDTKAELNEKKEETLQQQPNKIPIFTPPSSQPTTGGGLPSKLAGARFRQINETMYTTSSEKTLSMIQNDPIKFQEYHDGFQEQTKSWPKNPVKQIFDLLKKAQLENKVLSSKNAARHGRSALGALIVDLGAGTGSLAKWVQKETKWVHCAPKVISYDLLDSQDGFVKGLDIAKVGGIPLPGKEFNFFARGDSNDDDDDLARIVDVAVFCLSLMATNWIDKIRESSRILKPSGELIIAEVTSRFTDKKRFIKVIESFGFEFQDEDSTNTHFIIFTFRKQPFSQWRHRLPFTNQAELDSFIQSGQQILKPCIYKRR